MFRIILVEDDKAIALLLEINLRKRGYTEVEVASTLEEAKGLFEKFGSNPFHLAIVDMTLRKGDGELDPEAGIIFCGLLRSNERTQHIPIITTSAYADNEQELRLRQYSLYHFSKPLNIRGLLEAVVALLPLTTGGEAE